MTDGRCRYGYGEPFISGWVLRLLREALPGLIAAPRQNLKGSHHMQHRILIAIGLALMLKGNAMAQERILISSEWGNVTANLVDNDATRLLVRMLPLRIDMSDHLRQEKTGNLPSPLPAVARQQDFSIGTLGLWGPDHFVIYYRSGRVPQPGIVILGNATGDISIFDRPGPVTVRLERAK